MRTRISIEKPKAKPMNARSEFRGFTLIEPLVVISIIAILASLLLSGLAGAKESARSAKCKGNLRQMGIALRLYLDENQKYPPLLKNPPFLPILPNYATNRAWRDSLIQQASGNTNIFQCPSKLTFSKFEKGLLLPSPIVVRAPTIFTFSYDYNYAGSVDLHLGVVDRFGASIPTGLNPFNYATSTGIAETAVRVPSDMIAITDAEPMDDDGDGDYQIVNLIKDLPVNRHKRGMNVLFCDGHVEYGKSNKINSATNPQIRARWNADHESH